MKLKTLKDLDIIKEVFEDGYPTGENDQIYVDDLRKEALKWIKFINKRAEKNDTTQSSESMVYDLAVITWIKQFFNIK